MNRSFIKSVSSWQKALVLAGVLGLSSHMTVQAQCTGLTASDVVISGATCEGNGQILAPSISGAVYTLSGGSFLTPTTQSTTSFRSLSPGTYTLQILCPGASVPVTINNLVVPDLHEPLKLDLSFSAPGCAPTSGTITATASDGFNLGRGADYRFAIWPASEGGQNRADNTVSYEGIDTDGTTSYSRPLGTYYVRVKDKCNNFTTRSIVLDGGTTPAPMSFTISGTTVTANLNQIPEAERYSGNYSYYVAEVSSISECSSTSTPSSGYIKSPTVIRSAADLTFTLPAAGTNFRIVTTNGCGQSIATCSYGGSGSTAPSGWSEMFVKSSLPAGACGPTGAATLSIQTNNIGWSLVVTGSGYTSAPVTIPGTGIAEITGVPTSAYPLVATLTEPSPGTGVVTVNVTQNPDVPVTNLSASRVAYPKACTVPGHTNINIEFDGGIPGIEDVGTVYELVDINGTVIVTGIFDNPSTNLVRFVNVPVNDDYYRVRITPPGCTANLYDIGVIDPQHKFTYDVAPAIDCGVAPNSTFIWNRTTSASISANTQHRQFLTSSATFTITDLATNTVVSTQSAIVQNNPGNVQLPPGTYKWRVVQPWSAGTGCDTEATTNLIFEGVISVTGGPTISKTVGGVCSTSPTGFALIEFHGTGPFTIEYGIADPATGIASSYSVAATNVTGPTHELTGLSPNVDYSIRITDKCAVTATQVVTIQPVIEEILETQVQPCEGEPYRLAGVEYPLTTYEWKKGGITVSYSRFLDFASFSAADQGVYELTMVINGCITNTKTVTLNMANCQQPIEPRTLGSIGDKVWIDVNGNGIQDGGEVGQSGVNVTLYTYTGPNPSSPSQAELDNAANWSPASGVASQTTGPDGAYLFPNLESGNYKVKFELPGGLDFTGANVAGSTSENDSDAQPDGFSSAIVINTSGTGVAKDNLTVDAGVVVATGSIGSVVWRDNGTPDGLMSPGESVIPGVEVKLYKKVGEDWVLADTKTTDTNGEYLFSSLESGEYHVHFPQSIENGVSALTYQDVTIATGSTHNSKANRTTGNSASVFIDTNLPSGNPGRDRLDIDAGYATAEALPVSLAQFDVIKTAEGAVGLNWVTAMEKNASKFEIMQSANASDWRKIGEVQAKGNSSTTTRYSFIDNSPVNGVNYYRLRTVDTDGSFEYSIIRSIEVTGKRAMVTVFPNPVADYLQVTSDAGSEVSKIELFDLTGRRVVADTQMYSGKRVSVSNLSTGTYILRITLDNGVTEIRHIVIK